MPRKLPKLQQRNWPAAKISMWPMDKIKPYEKNPRIHPQPQIDLLAKLMTQYGVDQPIVLDEDGVILKGHGRRLAAIAAGFDAFPIVMHRGLTEENKTALRIADNQTALLSRWDDEFLTADVNKLKSEGFDLALLGFGDGELNAFMLDKSSGPNDPNAEWLGMPEFDQQNKMSFRRLIVHFKGQPEVDRFAELIGQKITPLMKYIWFPEIEIETYADKRYKDTTPEKAENES
jgi:ParB/Sulfiredoxin domain